MAAEDQVFNASEAAAFLGAHIQTIRKLARSGRIPAFKVGKDWRFRKEALLRWSEDQQRGQLCRIFVIDDDERVCESLCRMLGKMGCTARSFLRGEDALEVVIELTPDLILLDLVMPGMTGPQFLEQLRVTHPALPVIIVTGYPDSELMDQASRFAPVLLLSKPVDSELAERTIRALVGDKLRPSQG